MKVLARNICICSFVLVCTTPVFAQTAWIDSLKTVIPSQKSDTNKVNSLIKLSDALRFSFPDSALIYAHQALSLAEKLKFDNNIFWSIVAVNGSLYVLGNYALELDYAYKALPLAAKLNNPYTLGYSNGMLSDCYYSLGEYNTSLQYWREVIKICEENLPEERYAVYGNSSHIFAALHQYDSALIYAKKGYALFKENLLSAEDNYNTRQYKSSIFTSLGDAFEGKAFYDSALFYYRISLPFSDDAHMRINTVDAYYGIAKIYTKINLPDSAIWYAKKAVAEKIGTSYPVSFLKALNMLADIYQSKNNADSSLKYLRMSISLKDSLFNREKTTAFQNILLKEQEKKNEIAAAKSKLQNQYRTYFLIALFIILIIIAGVIIRNRRIKQLQKIRNNIADDLHDDIGSALSSISIMSELALAKSTEVSPILTSIGESTNIIQENMSDIVWTIKSQNDRFENVAQRMNRFASEILDAKNIELDFRNDTTLTSSKLTMEQRKNFYLFFKEVINNAAKYANAKKVTVCITQKDHYVDMNIADDGKGFDTAEIFTSNGMHTLKKRALELKGDFKIISHINKGTSIQLKFKIT